MRVGRISSGVLLPESLDDTSFMMFEMLECFFKAEEDAYCRNCVHSCREDVGWCVGVGF